MQTNPDGGQKTNWPWLLW